MTAVPSSFPRIRPRSWFHRVTVVVVRHLVGDVLRARREHADDLDVAAQRDGLDAVLGLPHLLAPHGGTEADEVLADLPAELLRGDHVAELVQADRRQDGDHEQHHPEGVVGGGHQVPSIMAVAASRAHASAARTASTVSCWFEGTSCCPSTAATVSTISSNASRPVRNASTQISLAAL